MARHCVVFGLGLMLLAGSAAAQEINYRLDAETLKDVLRTRDADEEAYLTYIAALAEQGQIPRHLVASTFQWARGKPEGKKVQYFKQAIIRVAADQHITLPQGTPSLTGTIEGRCYVRVLLVDVPAAGITVTLGDTKRTVVTDLRGNFRFTDVPYGVYQLSASGLVSLITRRGTATVAIPSPPPSTEAATANVLLR